jgi:peptidoglycan/LPS O-acetylase OafA/YrhL
MKSGVQSTYFGHFDWLRFVLALTVVTGHFNILSWSPQAPELAVRVFFALSGWLIGGILLRTELKDLPTFFFNRATRIWIPYLASLILLYGLSAVLEHFTLRRAEIMFYDITFTHDPFASMPNWATAQLFMPFEGGGVWYWSLSIEEQFYLIAPILVLMTQFGRNPIFWILLSVMLVAVGSDFAAVSFGVTAATLQVKYGDWHLHGVATAALATIFAGSWPYLDNTYLWPSFSIAVVMLLARPFPRHPIFTFAGGMSYPLYLNHWLGPLFSHIIVKRIPSLSPGQGFISTAVALIICSIMYVLIDRPVLANRSSFYSERIAINIRFSAYSLVSVGFGFGAIRWYVIPFFNH